MKVIENPWNQPDVSDVTPVYVPKCGTRSYTMDIIFLKNNRYMTTQGYWDDLDKCWRHCNGEQIEYEIVRTEPNEDTIKHFDD